MSAPFVISMKFTSDASGATAATGEIRQELSRLGQTLEVSRVKAVELQSALSTRNGAAATVAAYQSTLNQIRAEQQLEAQRLSAQISDTGRAELINRLAQLARDGAAATQALARAEAEATSAQGQFSQSAAQAAVALQQLAVQQERVAAARAGGINANLGVRDDFNTAARGEDIEAYGRGLDELRAKFNPLFAAEQRQAAAIGEINRAHRLGAITADEASAAIMRERAAYELLTQSVAANTNVRNQNAGASSFNVANIAAQGQDIAVTAAMGMAPVQIGLQQGTQLSAVLQQLRSEGQSTGAALASAFASIVSPLSLLTIGAVALGAAGIQAFMGMLNSADDAGEALKRHDEYLDDILVGYESVRQAAKHATEEAMKLPQGAIQSNLSAEQTRAQRDYAAALDAIKQANIDLRLSELDLYNLRDGGLDAAYAQAEAMKTLHTEFQTANPDLDKLVSGLTNLKNNAADDVIRLTAEELLRLATEARKARADVASLTASLAAIPAISFRGLGVDDALADIKRLTPELRTTREIVADIFSQNAGQARTTSELQALADAAAKFNVAMNAQDAQREAEKAARESERLAKQKSDYTKAIESIRERAAQQQIETNVIGLSTFAAERLRVQMELENAARRDAIGLTPQRIAQIHAEASAYAAAAAAQEEITERQRANEEQLDFSRSTWRSFITEMASGVREGQTFWEALGDAGVNALGRIADRYLGMAADGIFDFFVSAVVGGITGGGLAPKPVTNIGFGSYGSFDTGGWTGGQRGRVAGEVHGEEFVVRAGPAAANRAALEAINAGGSIGGGGSFTFAPVNQFSLSGGAADIPTFERMLDTRDAALLRQFEDTVANYLANPMRRVA